MLAMGLADQANRFNSSFCRSGGAQAFHVQKPKPKQQILALRQR
jgi:hypothetical protein